MILPTNPTQLTLSLEPGLAERYATLRDCMIAAIYAKGHGRMANMLDVSPSHLTEKLAGADNAGRPRGLTIDELERYVEKTGDMTPILYLVAKWLRSPENARLQALGLLADVAQSLPALLAQAGLTKPARGRK